MTLVAIPVALIFLLSLVSGRLERTIVTAPIVFTGAGMVAFLCLPGLRDRQANLELLLQIAEAGLVLLLFTDASRTDLQVLKNIRNLPVRLLSTGMLLTILLGALSALAIFPKLSLWEAGILAAILAPTEFVLFGLLVARDWRQFNALHAAYALLSLTVVRMLPVAIALIGTRLSRATVLFMGWFGPRGLASIVLGLVYLEQHAHQSGEPTIRLAVIVTVLLSIFAHGLSALPGMNICARKISALSPAAIEFESSPAEIRDLTANPAHRPDA